MKRFATVGLIAGVLALAASPAMADHKPDGVPGSEAGNPAKANNGKHKGQENGRHNGRDNGNADHHKAKNPKAKAYGKYCQGQSKKHVKGTKGTPFSACVTAMAKADKQDKSPRKACKALSKKHVKGEKGTPFSRCVVAARHLKKDSSKGQ